MANKTVYPYGTGGELPSSIGIINDLKTGGVDSALAAEQGVVIGNKLEQLNDVIIPIDFSFLTYRDRSVGTSKKWTTSTDYKHTLIGVAVGEKYKVTANQDSAATLAFLTSSAATTSGGTVPLVSGTDRFSISAGESEEITIPDTCQFLYVYAGTTASSGSGRQAVPQSVVRFVGMPDSIKSVYDEVKENEGQLALQWKPGAIIFGTGVADTSLASRCLSDYVDLTGITKIRYSRVKSTASSTPTWGMAFYDSEKTYISGQGTIGGASAAGYTDTVLDVPEGAAYARFSCWSSSVGSFYVIDANSLGEFRNRIPELNDLLNTGGVRERAVYPAMMYYMPSGSATDNTGGPSATYFGTGAYSTVRFIAVRDKNIALTPGSTRRLTIFEYDADFNYLGATALGEVSGGTRTPAVLTYSNTAYIKVRMGIDTSYTGNAKSTLKVEGKFPEDWDVFNVRTKDSGYQHMAVSVRVTDPTCCDEVTNSVQDASQILTDHGVICLPSRYTNTGRQTRLIIYCHGAAVNYADNATRFNAQDLEPQYWLAEGYAVMDIEGNPFDNTNEHICMPQTMDCYVAAYKWAIEFYNLRRDGILLGGRSMGGANTFNLMRRECPIPVIAACPNSAAPDSSFGYGEAARKAFCALHMGFVVPDGFTWSDGQLTDAEIQVLSDNWDKYIKCCPELSACENLPSKDVILSAMYGDERIALWSTLHMVAKCPVKLFGCNQDPSCVPSKTTSLYYRMLMNAGQIAECRLFNTTLTSNQHHYDTQDPNLRADITTSYGDELTNIPIVYIEMLAFWRRYEQGL